MRFTNFLSIFAAVVSVAIIILIIGGFIFVRPQVSLICDSIDKQIVSFSQDGIATEVKINQTLPIKIDMPLKDIINLNEIFPQDVKINQNVPINKTFHIKQDFSIDTIIPIKGAQNVTIYLNIPLYGQYPLNIPVAVDINAPINTIIPLDLDIPIKDNVNVNMTLPLKDMLKIDQTKMIHINKTIPVDLTIPVKISAQDLGLGSQMQNIQNIINLIRKIFLIKK